MARGLIIGGIALFVISLVAYVGGTLLARPSPGIDQQGLVSDVERRSAVQALDDIESILIDVEARLIADPSVGSEDLRQLYAASGSVTTWEQQALSDEIPDAVNSLDSAAALMERALDGVVPGDPVDSTTIREAASSVDEAELAYASAPLAKSPASMPSLPEYAAIIGAVAGLLTAIAGIITALTARSQTRIPQTNQPRDQSGSPSPPPAREPDELGPAD